MCDVKRRAPGLAALLSFLTLVTIPAAHAADAVGMRIVRDPVTGQLRAPTAEEAKAMDEQAAKTRADKAVADPAGAAAESPPPMEFRQSNGVRYRVGDTFLSYSVVTRSADGKLDMQCVTGKEAAEKLVRNPKAMMSVPTSTIDKEHGHAHQ